ncbi:phospholipase D family protein [Chitinophaga sp. 22620]|uniref:phospholipase D family protein n=1 Tax=Chitinophaga sp. 22620 TaxID=3453952 RepID=UPI003F82A1B7
MLHFQDPYFSNSYTLHEALIQSCSASIHGKGAYAFASKGGIEILFKDSVFDSLLERGEYSLIIGIDEITNLASLEILHNIKTARPSLTVKAFDHNNRGSLFHPKLSYFKNQNESGTLIVGSGNLTLGGLRRNREAFSLIQLSNEEFQRIEQYWNAWLLHSDQLLKEIDNPDVIRKARDNQYVRRARIIRPDEEVEVEIDALPEGVDEIEILHQDGWQFYPDSEVLIAEIPRSGDRWKQANFDIDTFRNFFGAIPGDNSQRILLRNINDDFSMSEIEVRPSVSVVSQNYRFELDAASGLLYPNEGKPIGVFVKVTTRMFLYHLYMPDQPLYAELNEWLQTNWTGREDRMKRITGRISQLPAIIGQSVFNRYLI